RGARARRAGRRGPALERGACAPASPGRAVVEPSPDPGGGRGRPSLRRGARGRSRGDPGRSGGGHRARPALEPSPGPRWGRCFRGRPADAGPLATLGHWRARCPPLFCLLMKTWNAKPAEVERRWYLVDAEGETLGRLATRIADLLRGKGKPTYTPHVDTGDFVVVVNAEKIAVTGSKLDSKMYYRHSGYPGGIKQRTLREQLERRPTEVIRKEVKGMLRKNKLASAQITKLKVYAGPDHPHAAQAPKPLELP